ncbi:MAG TPA: hypothetical protein PKC43_02580 [Phycisphaerales bacterium]|nr:hypothetical protein [Phycisphaerales bacterium]HMP36312.1 hypothetical protein [Phycisphaerales bacterium]
MIPLAHPGHAATGLALVIGIALHPLFACQHAACDITPSTPCWTWDEIPCCTIAGVRFECSSGSQSWVCSAIVIGSQPAGTLYHGFGVPGWSSPFAPNPPAVLPQAMCVYRRAYCGTLPGTCTYDPQTVLTIRMCDNFEKPTAPHDC